MIPLHQTPLKLKEALAFPKDDYLSKLKDAFLTKFHKQYTVFTADARNAIYLALQAMRLRAQDEVLVPAYVTQLIKVIVQRVCKPVYVDIDRTLNIDPEGIRRHITRNTRAILAVHLYGNPCNMEEIVSIARAHNMVIIEDVAQAFGGEYDNKMLGSFGDFTVFSFKFSKDITCSKGGALLSNEPVDLKLKPTSPLQVAPELLATLFALEQIRNTPAVIYSPLKRGFLFPHFSRDATRFKEKQETLCNYQYRLLYQQLADIDSIIDKRRRNAACYSEKLRDVAVIPQETEGGRHTYYRYTIQVDNRDQLFHYLLGRGVEADKMSSILCGILTWAA